VSFHNISSAQYLNLRGILTLVSCSTINRCQLTGLLLIARKSFAIVSNVRGFSPLLMFLPLIILKL